MRYRRLILTLTTVALTAATAFAQSGSEIKLRLGTVVPKTAGLARSNIWYAEEISKRSGGKIAIENFWSGSAGGAGEMLKLVSGGALDMGAFPGSWFPAQMPFLASFSALPLVLPDPATAQKVAYSLWEGVPAFQEEAKANNIHPLYFRVLNEYRLLCTSAIKSMADLQNKKIRSQGEYFPLAVRAVGAVPVTVLPGEFYEALQRGTIDCMLLPWDLLYVNRLHEVAKYGSDLSFGALVADAVFVNADRWKSFTAEEKKLMTEIGNEAKDYDLQVASDFEAKAVEAMKAAGMEVVEFQDKAAFKARMPDFLAEWQKRMANSGKGAEAAKTVEIWKSAM